MKALFVFWGKVISGAKRGKQLGYPTANIRLHKKIPEGIYAAEIQIGTKIYHGATFIGSARTFGEIDYKAESFLFDFNQSVYGKWMSVRLFKKLRDNKKFDSTEALLAQMEYDIIATKAFFSHA